MNDALKAVLQGLVQQPQRQDATNDQLRDLADFAVRLGMYDAHDVLKLLIARGLGADCKTRLHLGSMAERERCIEAVLGERVDADDSGAAEDHAVQAIRDLPNDAGAQDPKTAREAMLAELRNPWQGPTRAEMLMQRCSGCTGSGSRPPRCWKWRRCPMALTPAGCKDGTAGSQSGHGRATKGEQISMTRCSRCCAKLYGWHATSRFTRWPSFGCACKREARVAKH